MEKRREFKYPSFFTPYATGTGGYDLCSILKQSVIPTLLCCVVLWFGAVLRFRFCSISDPRSGSCELKTSKYCHQTFRRALSSNQKCKKT